MNDGARTSNCDAMVLVSRLAKVVEHRSTEDLLGMRLRQFLALSYLREHEPAPQQQMCETLCIDANNVVLLLNCLEAAGTVRRQRDPADRRRHLVELTPAGRRALERAERAQRSIEDELLEALDPRERATLRELLRRALAGAEESAGGAPAVGTDAVAA